MYPIFRIKQEQVLHVDQFGIHFVNDYGDEDFLAFAVCYESFALLMGSEQVVKARDTIGAKHKYQQLAQKFTTHPCIGIHDDLNHPDKNHLTIAYNHADIVTLYQFTFDKYENYLDVRDTIQAFGWHIFLTTEII